MRNLSKRLAVGLAVGGGIAVALWIGGRLGAQPADQAQIVSSPAPDTVPLSADAEAVGLCALNRATGALEGQIVGVEARAGGDRYRIESFDERPRAIEVRPEAVLLDLCERAMGADPSLPPLRIAPSQR